MSLRIRRLAVSLALLPALFGTAATGFAQAAAPAPAMAAAQTRAMLQPFRWRNIGPANMAGRVTHIEAVEADPAVVYVAAASGGVWKSVNAGTTWEPIFTKYASASIGALAIYQRDPNIVWVGTGEGCVRNSVAWGDGIYKSTDGGRTFSNVGLGDTHHIDAVVIHPTNPNIVYVAAQGHLWGYNEERGIFKTIDGGATWKRLTNGLPADDRTGASALVIDPMNPNVLYAGMWERIRRPHEFISGGPNGGLYKSTNGGDSWTKLTKGLPEGATGKIGLDIFRRAPRILTMIIEHAGAPGGGGGRGGRGGGGDPAGGGGRAGGRGAAAPVIPDSVPRGGGIYRSEDGGATWQWMNGYNNRPFYYSHIWMDPNESQRVYVLATNAQVSEDGGRTFARTIPGSIDLDFHALWINPGNSNHFYIGNDKGSSVTYDRGLNFQMFDNMDIGQFYAITLDNRDPYWVYGGLQDNGNWGGPSNSRDFNGILNDHWFKFHSGDGFHTTVDPNDWRTVYTETQNGSVRRLDAMFRQVGSGVTPNANNTLNFAEATAQPGAAPAAGGRGGGGGGLRNNWSTALTYSPHDSKILFWGAQYLFMSTNRGDTWRIISPDLTTNDPAYRVALGARMGEKGGAETHSSIITISESPLVRGVIWVGTDDGNVQVTRDGGRTWSNVRTTIPTITREQARAPGAVRGVPDRTWVSRVEASHTDPATAYVSFDGHRSDDFRPYIFKTADYGRTWTSISSNIPVREPVYVVKEDLRNPNLLFAGTEFGVHASVDGGASWQSLMTDMPTVAVHDLVIHPRDNDLVAGTHGRSIWIVDDISPLQQLTADVLAADAHVFTQRVATQWHAISRGATRGNMVFQGRNPLTMSHSRPNNSPPDVTNTAAVSFYLRNAPPAPVRLEIASLNGAQTFAADVTATQGINRYFWNMRFAPAAGAAGGGGRAAGAGGGGGGRGGGGRGGAAGAGAAGTATAGTGAAGGAPPSNMGEEPPALPQGGRGGAGGGLAEPGTYRVTLTVNGRPYVGSLTVRADPDLPR